MSFLCMLLARIGIALDRPDSNVFLIFAVLLPLAASLLHFALPSILTRIEDCRPCGLIRNEEFAPAGSLRLNVLERLSRQC